MNLPLRVLAVCTHNRTRSVITAALLGWYLAQSGIEAQVHSAGLAAEGLPPTDGAVHMLQRWGIDVSEHRSQMVTRELVVGADLVVTAQPDQVVWIAGRWPDAFGWTFTLPEICDYAAEVGPRGALSLDEWLGELAAHRPPARTYLERGGVPAVDDPTGHDADTWERVTAEIDQYCAELVGSLVG